jgi:hypothetical protein
MLSIKINAQEKYLSDKSQTEQLSKKVTELFKANKISESIKELTPYWPIPQSEIDAFEEKTIKYLNIYNDRYGAAIGSLKLKVEVISDIAIQETYLVRFKYTAIRLKFTFYRNDSGWILNSFKWDDSFTEEFK